MKTPMTPALILLLLAGAAAAEEPEPPAPVVPAAALAERLRVLENENVALRDALAQLAESGRRLAALEAKMSALAAPAAPAPAPAAAVEDRLAKVEAENAAMREAVKKGETRPGAAPSLSLFGGARVRLTGYLDIGYFDAGGDGTAYVRDAGKVLHPEFADVPWVFVGDPGRPGVNSQGDSPTWA
jgi:hypothetical protein